ncbi:MAG: hypothetical protein WCG85_22855 [Polyangia bacterium]
MNEERGNKTETAFFGIDGKPVRKKNGEAAHALTALPCGRAVSPWNSAELEPRELYRNELHCWCS